MVSRILLVLIALVAIISLMILMFACVLPSLILIKGKRGGEERFDHADIVILGAGTAGCVLARRLNEKYPTAKILVLDRGIDRRNDEVVYNIANAAEAAYTSPYSEVLQTDKEGIVASVGNMYGGGSSHSFALAVRGSSAFYENRWSHLLGISAEDLLTYTKRIESYGGTSENLDKRGSSGPVFVSPLPSSLNIFSRIIPVLKRVITGGIPTLAQALTIYRSSEGNLRGTGPFLQAFVRSVSDSKGVPIVEDYNTGVGACVSSIPQLFVDPSIGIRSSSNTAYIPDNLLYTNNSNLLLRPKSNIERIVFDGKRANAVEWTDENGILRKTLVGHKVVSCAGGIYTPWLLQKSGCTTPGIGDNLLNHYGTTVIARVPDTQIKPFSSGPVAFVSRTDGKERAWQVVVSGPSFVNEALLKDIGLPAKEPGYHYITFLFWLLDPKARGSIVWVEGKKSPNINLRQFEDPGDIESIQEGVRWLHKVIGDAGADVVYPPKDAFQGGDLQKYIEQGVSSTDHYSGTCALGHVVEPSNFKLREFENLHIVDTSVFPAIPDGNTTFPALLVAEIAADRI